MWGAEGRRWQRRDGDGLLGLKDRNRRMKGYFRAGLRVLGVESKGVSLIGVALESGDRGGEDRQGRRWGCVPVPAPAPFPRGHLLEGPALGYPLGAEVQQRLGPALATRGPSPSIALVGFRGAAPAPLGRGGFHPAGPGPGPGRGLSGGVGPMPVPLRRLPRPLPAFPSVLCSWPARDPCRTHPRPAPGRPGDAAPLRLFTTMKLLRPPL